jgi:hypothetical protein
MKSSKLNGRYLKHYITVSKIRKRRREPEGVRRE